MRRVGSEYFLWNPNLLPRQDGLMLVGMRLFSSGIRAFLLLSPLMAMADLPGLLPDDASKLQGPSPTEQEWIVSSICRNAYELLAFAKDKKGEQIAPSQVVLKEIPGPTLTYDVTIKGARQTVEAKLQWPESLWSPAAYLPFCQAVAKALKLPAAGEAKVQGNPLHALLEFSEASIESENQRVSQWLAAEPENAAAHEQAALILGTLATKENSGDFWDPRDACDHVAAHLSVAQLLRTGSNASVEGRLADCLVGLIADTKTETGKDLDQLAAEKNAPPDLAAWINACRMRNTRDWRIVKNPESASPLEQVEYFRARAEAADPDQAISWLQAHSIVNRPDWSRIVLEMNFSVEAGHAFAENSIAQELHVMQGTLPRNFSGGGLAGDLNEPPGDAVIFTGTQSGTPTVISRGMWAQFFQRHLCQAIAETGDFFANKWGVPENTRALDQAVEKVFSKLTFYPYLQLIQRQIREAPASSAAALALFTAHPEWGPNFLVWLKSPSDPDSDRLRQAATAWYSPPIVHATAFGATSRIPEGGWDNAQIDALYTIAPLQFWIAHLEVRRLYGTQYTFPQIQKIMGPLLDYYTAAIDEAKKSIGLTLDQRVQLAEKSAQINPNNYSELAVLYLDNHQEDKAAEAYQKWFDNATDRVGVSNGIRWLVDYDYDHGQVDKAMALAKDAAEVYSSRGLATMMHLLERMGRLGDAEEYGQKIMERYNEPGALGAFYKRHADKGEAGFQTKLDDLTTTEFPQGLKKVALASFSGPPSLGMIFTSTSDSMRANGIAAGQVIVALDGYEVQSQAQYTFVRSLSDSPEMEIILWDGQIYREIKANRPGRLFGVGMQDYHR
jgi:tetratricopeptide (TPR) repeat protein